MMRSICEVPAEWSAQETLWVGWPHLAHEWGDAIAPARDEIAAFIRTAARFVSVRVACGSQQAYDTAAAALARYDGDVELVNVPSGDIWLRDTGPIIAQTPQTRMALCFGFNGWGGKFNMPGDKDTAKAIASHENIAPLPYDFVLEGGALEFDGHGRVMTTRQCLLNPNRGNNWSEQAAEAALKAAFGVTDIFWLDHGLDHDHTDGHIDNLARFIGPAHVLCQSATGDDDPQAEILAKAEAVLRATGLRVDTIPSPGRIVAEDGEVLPASHMNFTLVNNHLILPVYDVAQAARAIERLQILCPDWQIIGLPAYAILRGGGSFHCMTREIPCPISSEME